MAGTIAIIINIIVLKAARIFDVNTAVDGLFGLLSDVCDVMNRLYKVLQTLLDEKNYED